MSRFRAPFSSLLGRGRLLVSALIVLGLAAASAAYAAHVTGAVDVKVTNDNNNVDGGLANITPSFDAQNRQANETTVAISPADPNIVAAGAALAFTSVQIALWLNGLVTTGNDG